MILDAGTFHNNSFFKMYVFYENVTFFNIIIVLWKTANCVMVIDRAFEQHKAFYENISGTSNTQFLRSGHQILNVFL